MALEDDCFSSISVAMEYLAPFRVLGSHKVDERDLDSFDKWVFCNPEKNSVAQCSIEERIRRMLITSSTRFERFKVVQFWALKKIAGSKCILTTSHQPFAVNDLHKAYYSYRKECMGRNINVGSDGDETQLGPLGRSFRNGFVEFSPDIRMYTIQEFPLRDHAILCGLGVVVSLPVFELDSNNILGVLEFLCGPDYYQWELAHDLSIHLKEVGVRTNYNGSSESMDRDEYSCDVLQEIQKMFKEVAKTHPLALGLALAPCCKETCLNCSGIGCLDRHIAVYRNQHMYYLNQFLLTHDEAHHTHRGHGVSGRAFASGKSCFCRDIRNFSILEYPLAHHARLAGLTFSVATCVQSIQDKQSNLLVLEFFLLPGSYNIVYIRFLMASLLTKIEQQLQSYKVAGEDFPGEELYPKKFDSLKFDEIDRIQVLPNPLLLPSCGCDNYSNDSCLLDHEESVVDFFLPAKLEAVNNNKQNIILVESSDDEALVFWSHDAENCHGVEESIKLVFKHLHMNPYDNVVLVQFWAPRRIAGRSFLTTFDQPFALSRRIKKVTCLYRKECMRRNIYVDEEGNNEEHLGPAGRAFKHGVAESTPDVRLYTVQEFPLRDHAVFWGIERAMFLPVFELHGKNIVGVLEILSRIHNEVYLDCLTLELKKMGLRIDNVHPQPGQSDSPEEIKKMFEAISVTYSLYFSRALTPSPQDYCHSNSCLGCFKQEAYYSNPICRRTARYGVDFLRACSFHHLQEQNGVAAKALASRRSRFCMNICNLGITDYPLSHYAKLCGFTFYVAICVQNTQFVDKLCVYEFFLLPGDYSIEYIGGLLDSLLISVKKHLPPNFKIMSEDVPGEPFFLEIGNFLENGNKAISSSVHVSGGRETTSFGIREENISEMNVADGTGATPLVAQVWINSSMHVADGTKAPRLVSQGENSLTMHVADGIEASATPLVPQGENISVMHVADGTGPVSEGENNCSTKSSSRQIEGNKFHIGLDELKLQFGKPLDEAAKYLGVSRSTLKRIRKSYGIRRWPSHKKNKVNQSLFMKENQNDASHIVEDITLISSGSDSAQPVLAMQTSIHSTRDLETYQHQTTSYGDDEANKTVAIKASYGHSSFIKFQLNTRSTLQDLQEQVTKRLKWDANRFEIKYQDEDKDWITIIIDEDLQYCLQTSIDRGQSTVSLSINLKLD